MKGVSAIIIVWDTSEDGNSMKNEGRLSYNHAFAYFWGQHVYKQMKGVSAMILPLDTSEGGYSMNNAGRLSYLHRLASLSCKVAAICNKNHQM